MVGLGALALLAAACGAPPGPQGWAGPRPITLSASQVILVAHRSHLYAMPAGSSNANWQFPPKDKSTYPLSEESQATLSSAIGALDIEASAKSTLQQKLDDVRLSGPSAGELKTAIDATSASSDSRSQLKNGIDSVVKFEKDSLSNLQALYGDLGLTSDNATVFVAAFNGYLFSLDTKTGYTRWIRDTKGELVGGVAVDGDTIYFGNKADLAEAWNAKTAERVWSFQTDGEVWATPTVDGSDVYVTSLDGSVYKLDKATGRKVWVFAGAKSGIAAKAVVDGSSVYVGAFDNNLYSLKTSDGSVNWSFSADNWFWATPIVKDGVVYAAALDGKLYAVDAASGQQKWNYDTGSAIRSGPVFAGGGVVVASKNGDIGQLDLGSGAPAEGSPVVTQQKILADLSTADGITVYISPYSSVLMELNATPPLGAPGSTPLPQ